MLASLHHEEYNKRQLDRSHCGCQIVEPTIVGLYIIYVDALLATFDPEMSAVHMYCNAHELCSCWSNPGHPRYL